MGNSSDHSPTSHVPHAWPGMFGLYRYSKPAVSYNLSANAWLLILLAPLGGACDIFLRRERLIGVAIWLLIALVSAGSAIAQIASVRRQRLSASDALAAAFSRWPKVIALTLLLDITYLISLLCLVIPFFFVLPRLNLAVYFMLGDDLGVTEAYRASWRATRGHTLDIWGVIAVNALIFLLAATVIGLPFAIYFYLMYSAALAVAYEMLRPSTASQPDGGS